MRRGIDTAPAACTKNRVQYWLVCLIWLVSICRFVPLFVDPPTNNQTSQGIRFFGHRGGGSCDLLPDSALCSAVFNWGSVIIIPAVMSHESLVLVKLSLLLLLLYNVSHSRGLLLHSQLLTYQFLTTCDQDGVQALYTYVQLLLMGKEGVYIYIYINDIYLLYFIFLWMIERLYIRQFLH